MAVNEFAEVINYIDEGTVIDHIPAGQGLALIKMLQLDRHQKRISIGLSLPSTHHGKKDMIKVVEKEFSPEEVNSIALFAPEATISIIREKQVAKKFQVVIPEKIEGFGQCPNERCITNHEPLTSSFTVSQQNNETKLCCHYCRKTFSRDAL
jgi:aspartate carbamoyltransferase regulatory subunit